MPSAGKRLRASHDWCWFCFPLANKSLARFANQSQNAVKQTQSKLELLSTANWKPRYMEWSSPLEERINYLQFVFYLRLCHILRTRTSKHSKWFVLDCPYLGKALSLSRPKHPAPHLQSVGENRTRINIQRAAMASLHDQDVKFPDGTFYGRRTCKHTTTN